MTYKAKTIDDNIINFYNPLNLIMNRALNIPADDLEISFLFNGKVKELKEFYIEKDNKTIFSGIVDTQKISIDNSGIFLNISARSKVAYLLDNEAIPQTYYRPSLINIFKRHVEPYGFKNVSGEMKTFSSEFIVSKGMSEWEVLENFCRDYLRVYPRITPDGDINATGVFKSKTVGFSNINNGIKYGFISENLKRYELYSQVDVRSTNLGSYSTIVKDEDSIDRGIKRRRLLNAVDDVKTPVLCGELMLSSAKRNSYEISLISPGYLDIDLGDKAFVDDYILGFIDNLIVSEIKYVLNKNYNQTKVLLRKEI